MYQFSLEGLKPLKSESFAFSDLQSNWLKALRSGKFKQGVGFLKDAMGGYCCLGILCEVAGLKPTIEAVHGKAFQFSDENIKYYSTGFLPAPVVLASRLRQDMGKFNSHVRFPNVEYRKCAWELEAATAGCLDVSTPPAHTSLAAMNDARVLDGLNGKRGFSHREIADYIEFDPWNVFLDPIQAAA